MVCLDGLTIVVTGSGQGIGEAAVRRFAQLGANVVVSDIDREGAQAVAEDINRLGGSALGIRADVTQSDDCAVLFQRTVERFGRVDVALCNAGTVQVKPFLEISENDWDSMFDVNVRGSFLTIRAAARQMLQQSRNGEGRPRGKIITMASIAGRYGVDPMAPVLPHYKAAKASVISLTQSASYAFAPNLTVNAVCPGIVGTDMWTNIDRAWSRLAGVETGTAWADRTSSIPLGRPQQSSDVVGLLEYLSSEGSDYMTGQAINIDGGLSMG